ncbi:MAG: hypothetical protein WDW36_002948 [Sanguina aurantia]
MAMALESQVDAVLRANAEDMRLATDKGVQGAMLDRLKLDASRVQAIAVALREVAALPDPVGRVTLSETRPNGLLIERVRVPLGVIAMIYEARPNVTADAAALCLFAGNGVILRGGSEALQSNLAIAAALHDALRSSGLPAAALTLVDDLSREAMVELVQLVSDWARKSDIGPSCALPRVGRDLLLSAFLADAHGSSREPVRTQLPCLNP